MNYLVENGLAELSHSRWAAPCLLVPKLSYHIYQICTVYRKLNEVPAKDAYPLPLIEQLLDQLLVR